MFIAYCPFDPYSGLGAPVVEFPTRSVAEVINFGVIVVNAWFVLDHSNSP